MRRVFSKFINDIGKDESVVLLVADVGGGIIDDFAKNYPNRFFNVGISEQTMIGMAAGMALQGLKPYVYGITPFLLERAFEQIKMDIDSMKLNVKIIGYDDYSNFGQSHQCLNEFKLLSCFNNIRHSQNDIPGNSILAKYELYETYKSNQPTIICLHKDISI